MAGIRSQILNRTEIAKREKNGKKVIILLLTGVPRNLQPLHNKSRWSNELTINTEY
jgi:hypothetical protein